MHIWQMKSEFCFQIKRFEALFSQITSKDLHFVDNLSIYTSDKNKS
jgi:hypothetical protein